MIKRRTIGEIITWFDQSPDAGHPTCVCSFADCEMKGEPFHEASEPVRVFKDGGDEPTLEARFHVDCFEICVQLLNTDESLPAVYKAEGFEPTYPVLPWPSTFVPIYMPVIGEPFPYLAFCRPDEAEDISVAVGSMNGLCELTDERLAMLKSYLTYYAYAPCWDADDSFPFDQKFISAIRTSIEAIDGPETLKAWLESAKKRGIDPF